MSGTLLRKTPADAANMTLRADLLIAIQHEVALWNVTQTDAAGRLGVTQPRLNALLKGKISDFSLDALINLASAAGLTGETGDRPRGVHETNARAVRVIVTDTQIMQSSKPRSPAVGVAAFLAAHGLILRGGFCFQPDELAAPGPSGAPAKSVLLVGHAGAAHWPHFLRWRESQPSDLADPLDTLVAGGPRRGGGRIRGEGGFAFRQALSAVPAMGDARRGAEGLAARHPHASRLRIVARVSVVRCCSMSTLALPALETPIYLCDACDGKPCHEGLSGRCSFGGRLRPCRLPRPCPRSDRRGLPRAAVAWTGTPVPTERTIAIRRTAKLSTWRRLRGSGWRLATVA